MNAHPQLLNLVRSAFFSMVKMLLVLHLACGSHVRGFQSEVSIDELTEEWKRQSDEVQTARLTLEYYSTSGSESAANWTDAEGILNQFADVCRQGISPEIQSDELKSCVNRLLGRKADEQKISGGAQLQIVQSGDDVRNVMDLEGKLIADHGFSNGQTVEYMPGLKGVIVDPGDSRQLPRRLGFNFVRPVPAGFTWQGVETTEKDLLVFRFQRDSTEVVAAVDRASKVLVRQDFTSRGMTRRLLLTDFDGVVAPVLGVDVRFRNGSVSFLNAFRIIDAQLNEIVQEDELQISVPTGTTVMLRGGPGDNRSGRTREETVAVDFAQALPPRFEDPARGVSSPALVPRTTDWNWIIAALTVVIGALISIWSIKLRNRRRARSGASDKETQDFDMRR